MPITYIQDAKQRFTEFGGFSAIAPEELPESVATWADCVLERAEAGLTTLVVLLTACPEGAMKAVRDDLTILADRIARQARHEVQALLLIITPDRLNRPQYDRWQELKVTRGAVRLVPWVVDLSRQQIFQHQGPPFGIDPDLETLAAPEPRSSEEPPAQPAAARGDGDGFPRPVVTIGLLGVLIGIWVVMTIMGGSLNATEETDLLLKWGAVGRPDMWSDGEFWRLFTACFLHIGLAHLAMNGYSLWVVGRSVEWLFGHTRMLFIYLAAGVAGSVASALLGPPLVLSAGASGAIFGLLGAIIWYRVSSPLGYRIKTRPLVVTLLLNLGLNLALYKFIDNWNHAGGLVGGFIAAAAIGVPAIAGEAPPRWRPGRGLRIAATATITLALLAFTTGQLPIPGPGRDLANAVQAYNDHRYAEAAAGLERAVRRQDDEPALRYMLIQAYISQGKCNQAETQLIQLMAKEPDYEEIPALSARLKRCRA
ncbi:MAG TPA: rhomboid family intramembrane serine protease [Symbiobacteriaceae bacterium]|nr:rhomboid family intramembrane serine protease [Symbiobacteriaceae bacterium]